MLKFLVVDVARLSIEVENMLSALSSFMGALVLS